MAKKATYILEIYKPGKPTEVLVSFTSSSPFSAIACGSSLDLGLCGEMEQVENPLRVAHVTHSISSASTIIQKTMIFTEEIEMQATPREEFSRGVLGKLKSWWPGPGKEPADATPLPALKEANEKNPNMTGDLGVWLQLPDINDAIEKVSEKISEELVPWIRKELEELWERKVVSLAKDTIWDDKAMAHAFRIVYQLLPAAARLWVQEESFIAFCLRNRERLIGRTEEAGSSEPRREDQTHQEGR